VRENNLRVAGYPHFEAKSLEESVSAIEFSATFEVYPDIALGDLSGVGVERSVVNVTPADVDKTVEVLRRQRVQFEPAERPAEVGDRISIDYRGTVDGVEFSGGKAENFALILGEGRLLKDFEAPLAGMKPGESKTIEVTFPADYHGKEVAGKVAAFEVRLNGVESSRLPEIDPEFAKSLGVADGDIDTMRSEIQVNLEREASKRVNAKLKEQVMQALLDSTSIESPKALVQLELERLTEDAHKELMSRGLGAKNMPLPQDLLKERAQQRVNLGLILGELVKAHNLHPKPEQVRAVVEDLAQSYENPAEVVKWHYSAPERLGEVESAALEDNVVKWVLENVKVTDKAMSLDELMGRS
jgi:trigger factor